MSSTLDSQLNETLRDALVAYYLDELVPNAAEFVDSGLSDKIKTANDLYEYKLLDVLVSQAVPSSPVASAIASLQQYINGALMGMEPGYEVKVMEDHLLTQWREINSQYPVWAANQQLRYYPEVYIDPSLRMSKSAYFQQLENDLNQNKIHIDTAQEAVLAYLASFEEVANLTIINGYINTDDFKNGMYYFIGKSRAESVYYWRSVDMSQRTYKDMNGTNPDRPKFDYPQPGAWSDWHKANLPISASAIERTIRPVLFNNRLFVFWVECIDNSPQAVTVEHSKSPEPGAPVTTVKANPMLRLNLVYKKYDDSWSVPQTIIEAWSEAPRFKTEDLEKWVESIAVHDSSTSPDSMFVAMYAGYSAGAGQDGAQDQYDFLKTAMIDKNFNVTDLFPSRGYVPSVGTAADVKAPHVLRVGRIYAHDNKSRFQFRLPALAVALKSVETSSPNTAGGNWNYRGWQTKIHTPVKDVDVRFNNLAQRLEFDSKISSSFSWTPLITTWLFEMTGGLDYSWRLTLITSNDPDSGPYEKLISGSTFEMIKSLAAPIAGKYEFTLEIRPGGYDNLIKAFIRDRPGVDYCELPEVPDGTSVSLVDKVVDRRALDFLSVNPELIYKGWLATPSFGDTEFRSIKFQRGASYNFQNLILRPTNLNNFTPAHPGYHSLYYSGALGETSTRYANNIHGYRS
ncbi:neuraminidase-like domain-containing protein [Pseudomonas sp. BIC9C]|uniref:neuraminidase-like domain-containing protein n=1 Tax=Pseudomonas sp. BIC9C TaxID=3078458 RepID=UPI002AD4174E|nr:neuraminidase-like domain-containing protein [Pseudomonas sp. BIC9C]